MKYNIFFVKHLLLFFCIFFAIL